MGFWKNETQKVSGSEIIFQTLQYQHRSWWISVPVCLIELQGHQKAFGWTEKSHCWLAGESVDALLLEVLSFAERKINDSKTLSLPLYCTKSNNVCPSLSLLPVLVCLSFLLTQTHKHICWFSPSTPLQPWRFLFLSAASSVYLSCFRPSVKAASL